MTQTAEQQYLQDFNNRKDQSWEVEYPSIGLKLHCLLNTDEDRIRENILTNLKRGHEQIWAYPEQETEVCICAGGPSLKKHFNEIKNIQKKGGKVIALANTAHILVNAGIIPNAHVLLDAKPRNKTFIQDIKTTYFIASQCDPEVFDEAEKTENKIYIWHGVNNDEEFQVIHELGDPWIPVQGGSTLTLRAIRLFNILGYKNFHIFGFDSCYEGDEHHAYEQPDADKHKKLKLEFEGRDFTVSPWMLAQFMEFQKFVQNFGMKINMKVYGNGLIEHLIRKGGGKVNIEE